MYKVTSSIIVLLAIGLCAAEPARNSRARVKSRGFARQEALPKAAPTGYPAAGVTPEVPFELPTETTTAFPEATNVTPDNTYGPPPAAQQEPELVYGPPDEIYGPPEALPVEPVPADEELVPVDVETVDDEAKRGDAAEEDVLVAVDEDGNVIAVSNAFDENPQVEPARLILQRRRTVRPAKLRLLRTQPRNFVFTERFQRF